MISVILTIAILICLSHCVPSHTFGQNDTALSHKPPRYTGEHCKSKSIYHTICIDYFKANSIEYIDVCSRSDLDPNVKYIFTWFSLPKYDIEIYVDLYSNLDPMDAETIKSQSLFNNNAIKFKQKVVRIHWKDLYYGFSPSFLKQDSLFSLSSRHYEYFFEKVWIWDKSNKPKHVNYILETDAKSTPDTPVDDTSDNSFGIGMVIIIFIAGILTVFGISIYAAFKCIGYTYKGYEYSSEIDHSCDQVASRSLVTEKV